MLSWFPGLDGGHTQTFSVAYSTEDGPLQAYKSDIQDPGYGNSTKIEISNLQPGTTYTLQITGRNKKGASQPLSIMVTTKGVFCNELTIHLDLTC